MPLTRKLVIDAAMRLVDDDGLDALSLRTLAGRLGVQAPTLYWHVKGKSELLTGLADAIMDEAIDGIPAFRGDDDGREWLLGALGRLRTSLLRHRDGARIVSGARHSLRRADFSELAMSTLVGRGIAAGRARLLVLAGERYTVGWVLEEQAPESDIEVDPDGLRARFPVATRAITDYFEGTGRTADDLFRDGARLVLHLGDPTG